MRFRGLGKVIDVGEVRVSRTTPDKARGKPRYVIYLPTQRNYLWEELWRGRVRVILYMEVVEGGGEG